MDRARPSDEPFRFLDLPKELRLVVYDHVPRTIDHLPYQTVRDLPNGDIFDKAFFTLIHRRISTSTALLCTSSTIYAEAAPIIHRTIRDFILNASPKIASDLSARQPPAGTLMRAAAHEFSHLQSRFHLPLDDKAVTTVSFSDYTSNISLFLRHLAQARVTTKPWDHSDMREITSAYSESDIFLPGSVKANTPPVLRSKNGCDSIRRAVRAFITTSSIQLLWHHIKALQAPSLGHPVIEHVFHYTMFSYPTFSPELRAEACSRATLSIFLRPQGSVCYDFGVDIGIAGYVETDSQFRLERLRVPVMRVSDVRKEWVREGQAELSAGVGRVVFLPALTREDWDRDWIASGDLRRHTAV